MTVIKSILLSILLGLLILMVTGLSYFLGASVYPVFAVYFIVAIYGVYKKYWDLVTGILWALVAHMGFYYWAGYWISQIN